MNRCMAVTGTVFAGPLYCGYRTELEDKNGRPCCKRHLDKQLGIEWLGDRGSYPHGTGDNGGMGSGRNWHFAHGELR